MGFLNTMRGVDIGLYLVIPTLKYYHKVFQYGGKSVVKRGCHIILAAMGNLALHSADILCINNPNGEQHQTEVLITWSRRRCAKPPLTFVSGNPPRSVRLTSAGDLLEYCNPDLMLIEAVPPIFIKCHTANWALAGNRCMSLKHHANALLSSIPFPTILSRRLPQNNMMTVVKILGSNFRLN